MSVKSVPTSRTLSTIGWITLIVIAELISFSLLQSSVEEDNDNRVLYVIIAMIIFGTVVPLAFRETLYDDGNMAVSNLYWIILSHIGTVLLAYIVYKKNINLRDWIAFGILSATIVISLIFPDDNSQPIQRYIRN